MSGKIKNLTISSNCSLESIVFEENTTIESLYVLGNQIHHIGGSRFDWNKSNTLRVDLPTSTKEFHLFNLFKVPYVGVVSSNVEYLTIGNCLDTTIVDLTRCSRVKSLNVRGSRVSKIVVSDTIEDIHISNHLPTMDLTHCSSLKEVKVSMSGEIELTDEQRRQVRVSEITL